jgi:hypothetical protein
MKFLKGLWAFFKDQLTDSNDKWDSKLILGDILIGFAIYYIGWLHVGDSVGFLAISGLGAFLHGWAASPWGGSAPLSDSASITETTKLTTTVTGTQNGGA